MVHYEFLPQGRTVNKENYLEVMSRLSEAIRQKRLELWKKTIYGFCTMITHQLTHPQCLCVSFWVKTIMPQPYSLFLAPADFFLFPKLKTPMKGKRFAMIEEIKEKLKQNLVAMPKRSFHKCFEGWKKCWHKCIISEGGYFQRDNLVIDK